MPDSRFFAFAYSWVIVLAGFLVAPASAGDGDAIAIINGRPLSKEDVVRLLLDSHGVEALQQFVLLDIARQETKTRGIKITDADIEHEKQRALDELAAKAGLNGASATQENKEQALKAMLDEKHISLAEYNLAMERNAHLRRLVENDLNITEETLRAEFAREYGERRVVRHIQIRKEHTNLLNQALSEIKQGTDFANVARRISENPQSGPKGGEMDPFAFDTEVIPPQMREQAFMLKVGEVSNPLRVEEVWQILKLERIIPPDNVKFEDVRAEMETKLRSRVSQEKMAERMTELFKRANVNVLDGKLKRKYDDFVRESKAKNEKP